MDYFPLFTNLREKRCIVIGGGNVALRKIRLLLQANANVLVIAPRLQADVQTLVNERRVSYVSEPYRAHHLRGGFLVIAATNDAQVNARVFKQAESRNVLCNSVDDPRHSNFITPAIVDRSPVVIAISSGGAAPVLARMLREKFEREIPARLGALAQIASAWRVRVKERLYSITSRRRFWEALFTGALVNGTQVRDIATADNRVSELLASHEKDDSQQQGEAWLVGAGPGDPELLTIRAQQLLHKADVVLYDRLVSKEILAMARRDAQFINVGKPLAGTGNASRVQMDTHALLIKLVRQGLRVCRLKGGDPFIFGRGGEEITALQQAGLNFQIVPGITAAAACAAYAGIPLTHRDHAQSVVFLTGHGKDSIDQLDWASLARDRQTLAVYMGVSHYAQLSYKLRLHGANSSTPVAIIERGTTAKQRVVMGTLGSLAEVSKREHIEAPAMLIIGDVARYAQTQQWFRGADSSSTSDSVTTSLTGALGYG